MIPDNITLIAYIETLDDSILHRYTIWNQYPVRNRGRFMSIGI